MSSHATSHVISMQEVRRPRDQRFTMRIPGHASGLRATGQAGEAGRRVPFAVADTAHHAYAGARSTDPLRPAMAAPPRESRPQRYPHPVDNFSLLHGYPQASEARPPPAGRDHAAILFPRADTQQPSLTWGHLAHPAEPFRVDLSNAKWPYVTMPLRGRRRMTRYFWFADQRPGTMGIQVNS